MQSGGGGGRRQARIGPPSAIPAILGAMARMRWWWVAGSVVLGCPSDDTGQDASDSLSTTFGTDGTTTASTTLGTDVTSATMTASTTNTTADSSGTDTPIFDVGVGETGTDTGNIGDICKVEDGEISGDAPCEKVAPPDSFSPDLSGATWGRPDRCRA